MGQCSTSNEIVVGTAKGAVRAWAIRRRPADERWSLAQLEAVVGTPRQPVPERAPTTEELREAAVELSQLRLVCMQNQLNTPYPTDPEHPEHLKTTAENEELRQSIQELTQTLRDRPHQAL